MALTSTICKCNLDISDMDRDHYGNHVLTLARHPSETDERMMVRLLAFCLFADVDLRFGGGISANDEPDLWRHDRQGLISHWIDLGQLQEKRLRQSCSKAARVTIITYQDNAAAQWWRQIKDQADRFLHLDIIHFPDTQTRALVPLAARQMQLQCTIQDGLLWLTDGALSVELTPIIRKSPV